MEFLILASFINLAFLERLSDKIALNHLRVAGK